MIRINKKHSYTRQSHAALIIILDLNKKTFTEHATRFAEFDLILPYSLQN